MQDKPINSGTEWALNGHWMGTVSLIILICQSMAVQQMSCKTIQMFWKQWISLLGREFISAFQSKFRTHPILLGNKIKIKRRGNVKSQEKISIEAATSALSFTSVTHKRLSNICQGMVQGLGIQREVIVYVDYIEWKLFWSQSFLFAITF